jgi:hypothetical protein
MSYGHSSSSDAHRSNSALGQARAIAGSAVIVGLCLAQVVQGQAQYPRDPYDRYDRHGRYDAYSRLAQIDPGTFITVRTREAIDTDRRDGQMFAAAVESDVWDDYRRLAIPAIPRGSRAELLVRSAPDGDLVLDLESITVGGQRYEVSASAERIEGRGRDTGRAAEFVGGGALLGTIIGAIAGGGKGAAIGAAAGAGAGTVGLLTTRGRSVRVPAGSLLTFRLERPLAIGVPDYERDRRDYRRR